MQNLNKFAKLSIIFGIISILLYNTVVIPLVLGGLGLIFAELSKGEDKKMSIGAMFGSSMCAMILVVTVGMGGYSVYKFQTDPEYRARVNAAYEEIYGVTLDEQMNMIRGDNTENL
jgi:hypothetical protein